MTQSPVAANNKPEGIDKNPPAMYNASVLYSPPTLGQAWGWIAYFAPERLSRMLQEVGERTADLALPTFEVAIKAMGAHEPPEREQLELFRIKPVELWMEEKAKFPWEYEKDLEKWNKLEQEYGPEPAPSLPEVV